jgi:hypothetical protein
LLEDVPLIALQADADLERAVNDGLLLFGAYKRRTENVLPHVILVVRSFYHPMPRLFTHTPAMTIKIAKTIGHEVGHHLIAEKKFALLVKSDCGVLESEEEFAERYARLIVSRMQRRWWYRVSSVLLKIAAALNFHKGASAWKKGNYAQAADYFDMAIQVDPSHRDANYWFSEARRKASSPS